MWGNIMFLKLHSPPLALLQTLTPSCIVIIVITVARARARHWRSMDEILATSAMYSPAIIHYEVAMVVQTLFMSSYYQDSIHK